MRFGKIIISAASIAALVLAVPTGAEAKPPARAGTKVLSTAVIAPFNIAVGKHRILVADGATATLSKLQANGTLTTIARGPDGGDLAGVAIGKRGRTIGYTTTAHPNDFENANGTLHIRHVGGGTLNSDLALYETTANPDQKQLYGVLGAVNDCAVQFLENATGHPVNYIGVNDSHPYSVAAYKNGSWLVADAGGNDIVKVDRRGLVTTVAVLPMQPLTFTADMLEAADLPGCLEGLTYRFEPVPTDVEVGKDGYLYVSTLAGGPETSALGARSSVYRVNPKNGKVKLVATGLSGATNLAVHKGRIYVAEYYSGQVSVIKNGKPKRYLTLPGVVSIESGRGHLYAGTFASDDGPGTILRLTKGKAHGEVLATVS